MNRRPARAAVTTALMAAVLVGCSSTGPAGSAAAESVAVSSLSGSPDAASGIVKTVTPSAEIAVSAEAIARAYAAATGLDLAPDSAARVDRSAPSYGGPDLWRVTLSHATYAGAVDLRIFIDDSGAIQAVEDDIGSPEPAGPGIARADALGRAATAFHRLGIDAEAEALTVVDEIPDREWTITLERAIDGYPVANHPYTWGIAGDRMWITLRGDGAVLDLYALRPPSAPMPSVLLPETDLRMRLSAVTGLPSPEFTSLHPLLTWVRALDTDGVEAPALTLNYCVTESFESGWASWCVDAGTGAKSLFESAND